MYNIYEVIANDLKLVLLLVGDHLECPYLRSHRREHYYYSDENRSND